MLGFVSQTTTTTRGQHTMRKFVIPLGIALNMAAMSLAFAVPMSPGSTRPTAAVVPVRLVCNQSRCIDPETGAYTQSGCDYRGCHPISGIAGYDRSGGDRDRRYGDHDRYRDRDREDRPYGR